MATLDVFAFDAETSENGKWFVMYQPPKESGEPPIRMCIRSMQSEKYRTEWRKLQRSYKTQLMANDGELKVEEQDEFDAVLGGRALVVAWEGVQDANKVNIPYSQTNVQNALRTHALLRRLVYQMARNDDAFKPPALLRAEREQLAGNSARPSGITSA